MRAYFILCFLAFFCLISCDSSQQQLSDEDGALILAIEKGTWTSSFDKAGISQQIKTKFQLAESENPNDIIDIELGGIIDEIGFYSTPEMGENFHFVSLSQEKNLTRWYFGISSELLYNYYEFQVENVDGKPVIKDVRNLFTGELLSERIFGNYNGKGKTNHEMLNPMFNDYIEKRCDIAWIYYSSLPETIQQLPAFIEIKLDVASCISDSLAQQVRKELIQSNTLSAQSKVLHQVELGRVSSDVALLQEAIPKLEKFVGKDPYLERLIPQALATNQKFDEALVAINQFLEKSPDSEWAHYLKLDVYLFAGNEMGAKQWLSKIKERFTVDNNYLKNLYEIHPELQ